jgi:predicted nuclease with TOPRIM domain
VWRELLAINPTSPYTLLVIWKENMSVDEISRIRLARRAVEVFGEAEAATLMEHLPLGGVSSLATKDDLKILGAELRLEMAELRADFGTLRGEFGTLRGEFGELKGEFGTLRGEFGELKGEFGTLRGEFGELRAYIEERFHRQTITMITTMSALMGILFVALKWA